MNRTWRAVVVIALAIVGIVLGAVSVLDPSVGDPGEILGGGLMAVGAAVVVLAVP